MSGIFLFLFSIFLMLVEVPVGLSLIISGSISILLTSGFDSWWFDISFFMLPIIQHYGYIVIPLFLLMGQIAAKSSITQDLIHFSNSIFGKMRGAVALACIFTAAMFGSICGSSIATVSSLGPLFYKTMKRHGYSDELIFGVIAAGGTLGILIPPSIILIIYGMGTHESITKLFIAAIPPSMIAVAGYMTSVWYFIKKYPLENKILNIQEQNAGETKLSDEASSTQNTIIQASDSGHFASKRNAVMVLMVFFGTFFLMYIDMISPQESSSIIISLITIYQLVRDRGFNKKLWRSIFDSSARTTGMIIFIFLGATIFNIALAQTGFPRELSEFILQYKDHPRSIILCISALFLILGCVMDGLAMVLLFAPLLHPAIITLDIGINPEYIGIWFGVLMLMLVEVALITPPVGMNLFIIKQSIKELSGVNVLKGVKYFIISDLLRILLLIFYPSIVTIFLK